MLESPCQQGVKRAQGGIRKCFKPLQTKGNGGTPRQYGSVRANPDQSDRKCVDTVNTPTRGLRWDSHPLHPLFGFEDNVQPDRQGDHRSHSQGVAE